MVIVDVKDSEFCLWVGLSTWKLPVESVYQEPFLTTGNNIFCCQLKTSEMLKFHCVHSLSYFPTIIC